MSAALATPAQAPVAIALRAATLADSAAIWAWNSAPDVRAVSKDARPIPRADHERWFAARLAAGRPTWIVLAAGEAVGVVRVDPVDAPDGTAGRLGRLSIALGAEARGRGAGRRAIALACAAWGGPVIAEIAPRNLASRAAFVAAGFAPHTETDDLLTYLWTPSSVTAPTLETT